MNLRNILGRGDTLILDGAMGTYYNLRNELKMPVVDLAVLENPDEVRAIYREYLQAGADVLNTNTFGSNSYTLKMSHPELKQMLQSAYDLAADEARSYGKDVAADIGPLPEMMVKNVYKNIAQYNENLKLWQKKLTYLNHLEY